MVLLALFTLLCSSIIQAIELTVKVADKDDCHHYVVTRNCSNPAMSFVELGQDQSLDKPLVKETKIEVNQNDILRFFVYTWMGLYEWQIKLIQNPLVIDPSINGKTIFLRKDQYEKR